MKIGKSTVFITACAIAVLAATAGGIHLLMSNQQDKVAASKAATAHSNLLQATIIDQQTHTNKQGTAQPLLHINTNQLQQCNGDISLNEKSLLSLPQQHFKTKHTWAKNAETFSGPLLEDVLNLACRNVSQLMLRAINDYSIEMNFNKIQQYNPIVALSVNGKRLSIRNKGPLWIMMPMDEFPDLKPHSLDDMLIWQLSDIRILSTNEPT